MKKSFRNLTLFWLSSVSEVTLVEVKAGVPAPRPNFDVVLSNYNIVSGQ